MTQSPEAPSKVAQSAPGSERPVLTSLSTRLTRLILGQLIVLGVAFAGATVYQHVSDFHGNVARIDRQLRQALASKGQLLARNQSIVLQRLMADYALSDMAYLVSTTVKADRDVLYGVVTDAEGVALALSVADDVPRGRNRDALSPADWPTVRRALHLEEDASSHATSRTLRVWDRSVVEHVAIIRAEDGQLSGVLRYGLSTAQVEAALADARRAQSDGLKVALGTTAAISVAALLLGLAVSLRQSRRMIRPVQELTRAASALARGDRNAHVRIRSHDELQVLGEAFNRMVEDLGASYEQLERTNMQLMEQIAERELAEAERRSAEQQLAQAQKMEAVGQLAGGVAHDFNNLLTVIMGHSAMLGVAHDDAAEVREHVAGIEEAAKRAANLTRQLLTFSRRDQDAPRVVDLGLVVRGIAPMLRRLLRENVQVDVDVPDHHVQLEIDPSRLEQVIMNLAINAGDAMPSGGRLRLVVETAALKDARVVTQGRLPAGDYACLRVIDSGTGVAPENLPRIFEPFFTTKGVGKGTGLGLAMVHAIVRRALGTLDVQSTVGMGTTFTLYFPRVADRAAASSSDSAPVQRARGDGQLILLCEDDAAVRQVTEAFLSQHGYRVVAFGSPSAALSYARTYGTRIQILVSDVVMPEMSGPALAQAVRERVPNLPVLYLSGYTGGELEDHGVPEASRQLIRKPFTSEELCRAVHDALRWRPAAQTA